ncbi:MAG: protein kinase [Phycisphaerales bacterium]
MTAPPTQIGPYTIEAELGRGGMGVVYRATDTRLDRAVAIKALPDHLEGDPERLARFEREAKTLASINHPNIAGIHGVEEHQGRKYLVLEFVEGETLADRLDRGPLPVDETIDFCEQICAGVEAAHEAGVIHRDLKPANIVITPDGKAKVLDFGLARVEESASASGSSMSPTLTSPAQGSPTMPGVILGTAAYMSPEQARGRRVDKRTDIWSFGVILFECLTGASPFGGETVSDSIGAILHKPIDLARLPHDTPPAVHKTLRRCLQRDRAKRFRDIGDACLELLDDSADAGVSLREERNARRWIGLAGGWIVAVAATAAAVALAARSAPESSAPQRLDMDIVPRAGLELARILAPPRISPDSSMLTYLVHQDGEREPRIAVRDLHTGAERVLRGPRDPRHPVWGNDDDSIIYATDHGVVQIDVNGGRPQLLSSLSNFSRTAPAGVDNTGRYVFSYMRGVMLAVEPGSDEPVELIDPIPGREGDWSIAPSFLPDGEHVLFSNQDDVTVDSGLYVGSIIDGSSRRLLPFETSCVFVEPDIVVYWQDGDLFARRFDLDALEFIGDPIRVAESVMRRAWPMFGSFDANADTLAYVADDSDGELDMLTILDIESGEESPIGVEGSLWSPAVSPDGRRLVFDRTVDATAGDIVVLDFATGTELTLSRDEANESLPVWSPDGDEVYFFRGPDLYRVPSDASREPVRIYSSQVSCQPFAVTPDGAKLLFTEGEGQNAASMLDLRTGEAAAVRINDPNPYVGRGLTSDGQWLLYIGQRAGESRFLAARLDGEGEPVPISPGYGEVVNVAGEWAYYRSRSDLLRVRIQVEDGELVVGEPERILSLPGIGHVAGTYDGAKLILTRSRQPLRGGSIRVVRNWIPESLR